MSDPPNVYIFNKIENNGADVDLLKSAFESLGCDVKQINDVPLDDLKAEVEKMRVADFKNYKYVVIVILDNTNKDRNIWKSSDSEKFYLNDDLLNRLKTNKSLKDKLVLSIFQNNNTHDPSYKPNKNTNGCYVYTLTDARIHAVGYGKKLGPQLENNDPSTFIRVLCEQIKDSKNNNKSIEEILFLVTDKVLLETGDSSPVKELTQTWNLNMIGLGNAKFISK